MDQPTAERALKELEALVGEWTLEAIPPGGEPWPGEARATFEWHDSGAHLVERSWVEMPEAPHGVSIMGCDAARDLTRRRELGDRLRADLPEGELAAYGAHRAGRLPEAALADVV